MVAKINTRVTQRNSLKQAPSQIDRVMFVFLPEREYIRSKAVRGLNAKIFPYSCKCC